MQKDIAECDTIDEALELMSDSEKLDALVDLITCGLWYPVRPDRGSCEPCVV
jgi:hypothetical protein